MYPILLQLGPMTIYSLWVFVAIGFFVALVVLHKLIHKDRQKLIFISEHSLAIFFGGLIMSRLFFVLRNLNFFFGERDINHMLEILFIWDKGLSIWGGLFGILLTLFYFCRKNNENILQWLDIITITTLSGFIMGNIGAFLDGRNYGRETSLPWGITIENSRFAVPIHPTQLYAAIYTLLLTIILFLLYRQYLAKEEGKTALLGVFGYSIMRFLEEFLRGDESNIFLGLREVQIYCIIACVGAIIVWYSKFIKPKNKTPQ